MKKIISVILLGLLLFGLFIVGGCSKTSKTDDINNVGLANPASVYCEEQGGKLEMVNEENGTRGICITKEGTRCDEWEYYRGECFTLKNNKKVVNTCTEEQKSAQICKLDYNPVCGSDGLTYGNSCGACAAKVDTWTQGECISHVCTTEEKANKACTREYMPVCGSDSKTYGNKCTACSEGIDSYVTGECSTPTCSECPLLSQPSPDFCKDGKVVAGVTDNCGCIGAPKCEPVACTMDAKVCSDGSYVGRIAPDCEFAPCPINVTTKDKIYCKSEQRNAQVCTLEYRPVCGWFNNNIKCIKYPCAITADNPCNACSNENVEYWTDGECPN
ncbi:MAG: DUF333 domain-containing protein [Candidatus Woesearchaeota archaeon]|jgi:putative hemolysin